MGSKGEIMTPMNDDLDMTDNEFEESMAEGVDVQVATSRADYLRLARSRPRLPTLAASRPYGGWEVLCLRCDLPIARSSADGALL